MLASVSTRVVSWNDAAEMKLSVESEALVMPRRSGVPSAGSPPRFITFSFSSMKRKRSSCSSTNKLPRGSREPTEDQAGVVAEGQLLRIELDVARLRWKL